jgi:hypothetical protein
MRRGCRQRGIVVRFGDGAFAGESEIERNCEGKRHDILQWRWS